jgi:iduronate 2-sulfatase
MPEDMRDELMMGYWAGISFLDAQIGRILDTIDELKLWNNLTIVFTADHGFHNGEKGIWYYNHIRLIIFELKK